MYSIVGAAFNVMKELGPGFHEKPYERALIVELRLRGLTIDQQKSFKLDYKGVHVGDFIPDLIVNNSVIIDTITNIERGQMLNYLRITGLRIGLILNFYKTKLQWERLAL